MSREIKVRAWDTEEECWVEDEMNIHEHLYECECSDSRNSKWVLNWIVEQYTGLKDKNGKEIYEGDIVKWPIGQPDEQNWEVYWDGKYSCFHLKNLEYTGEETDNFGFNEYVNDKKEPYWEVIGNIHENPELLEGKK